MTSSGRCVANGADEETQLQRGHVGNDESRLADSCRPQLGALGRRDVIADDSEESRLAECPSEDP